jgi:hypothetical protein
VLAHGKEKGLETLILLFAVCYFLLHTANIGHTAKTAISSPADSFV